MSALDALAHALKPHGFEVADAILSPIGSLHRSVQIDGLGRSQWLDFTPDGEVEIWGGGLPEATVKAVEVEEYLRKAGAIS